LKETSTWQCSILGLATPEIFASWCPKEEGKRGFSSTKVREREALAVSLVYVRKQTVPCSRQGESRGNTNPKLPFVYLLPLPLVSQ
jgi:hypothetical protein